MAKLPKKGKNPRQSKKKPKKGNTYDKILKENFRELVVPLVFRQEGIDPIKSEPLPEELNSTISRKIDFLMRVLEKNDHESIVHIEFQTRMPRAMVYRVAEYHGFLLAKYKLPIRHFVVYLGKSRTKVPTELPKDLQFSGYKMIALNQIPFENLVKSKIPEEIILAIFAHYPKHDPERVARIILYRLKEVCKDEVSLRKFITQLTLLSQLRKLDGYVKQIANSMPITIDLRENAMVKDLIAEVQAEWELEHHEKLKAIEEMAESEKVERLQAEQKAEQEHLERLQAEEEAEEERQRINSMILSLYQEFQMPIEQIARMANKDLEYIEDLIAKAAAGNDEN
jgi:hypothetical protein